MAQEIQVYANDVVETYPIDNRFKISLADISIRDYGKSYGLSSRILAIDMDAYETSLSGDNGKTVDSAIGIANYTNNTESNPRLLLVELRIGYTKKAKNSAISSMMEKEAHSRHLLSGRLIDSRCFFIFSSDVAPRKRSEVANKAQIYSQLSKWQIVSPADFNKQFCFSADLPYIPQTDLDAIRQQADMLLTQGEWVRLLELLSCMYRRVEKFRFSYEIEEARAVFDVIHSVFTKIDLNEVPQESTEVQLNYMILDEDMKNMQRYLC